MTRVLYIDDDKFLNESMVVGLESCGYAVQFENKAEAAAITISSNTPFDVVVLDIMMRKGALDSTPQETQTGYILYRLIREHRGHIPIVVNTVCTPDQMPHILREDTNLQWLKKPVLYPELDQAIKELLKASPRRTHS